MDQPVQNEPKHYSSFLNPMLLGVLLLLLALTAGSFYLNDSRNSRDTEESTFCTMEAKICPDGSSVGRSGPNCEFAPCPSLMPTVFFSPAPTVEPPPTGSISESCCTGAQLRLGYECVKDCGPPIARDPSAPDKYSCLSKEEAESRKYYGCPICLSSETMISTPSGEKNIKDLQAGDAVWSVDAKGKKVSVKISQTYMAKVPKTHTVYRLLLSDSRQVIVSPYHALTGKKVINDLKIGAYYDKAVVKKLDLILYNHESTYDILPESTTGYYWANGILMGSTLKR